MIHKNLITVLLLWTGLLLVPLVFAQDEAPATEQEEEETNTGSQETEYNDDNYRRFMELKDQPSQTSTLPTNAYQSGTEKLDELPEKSQKHLRNQLREIILESDEWAPGDEDGEYPFVASEAGEKNPALKQQEAEAWGELVGKYHEREAQIYANAARSDSATGQEGGAPDAAQAQANAGESGGKEGSNSGEGSDGANQDQMGQKQSGQQGQSAENQTASNANEGSDSASSASASAGDPNAISTSGVSESALEYLLSGNSKTGSSKEPGGSPGTQDANAAQQQAGNSDPGQTGSPSQQAAGQQAAGQQSASQESAAQQSAAQQEMAQQQASATESAQAESESLSNEQSSQQQNQQQQTTQQNPSEFVVISNGTLSIKELQNAQGITITTGSNSSQTTPVGTEKDQLRKDDEG